MKPGTTRGFCETWPPQRGSSPDVAFGALSGKADSNEKKNEGLFIGSRVLLRTNGRDETLAGLYPLSRHNAFRAADFSQNRLGRGPGAPPYFFPAAMRRSSSSFQFWATTISRALSSSSAAFSIRKRLPSPDTS